MIEHSSVPAGEIHAVHNWVVADEAALYGLSVTSGDVRKYAFQTDGAVEWMLVSHDPVTWARKTLTWGALPDKPPVIAAGDTAAEARDAIGAETAGAAAIAVTAAQAYIGFADGLSSATIGTTAPNASNGGAECLSVGAPIPAGACIDVVSVRASAAMVADVILVNALTRKVVATAAVNFASGVSSVQDPFSGFIADIPVLVFINRTSGGFLRLVSSTERIVYVAAASYSVGDTLPAYTIIAGYSVAIEASYKITKKAPALGVNGLARSRAAHLTLLARGDSERLRSSSVTLAPAGASTSGTRNSVRYLGRGVLQSVALTVQTPSAGLIELWREIDGVITLLDVEPANLEAGANTVLIPGWQLSGVSYIAYRQISGVNVSYAAEGSYFELTPSGGDLGATATVTQISTFSIVLALTVDAPAGATEYENNSTGPGTLDRQSFSGSSTPAKWTVASPFAVSNGLLASTAGGWSSFAGWSDFLSLNKRRLICRVKINDTTSIFGIASKPDTSAGAVGGAVAMVDGVAGKLRIYSWNGSTSGTLATEVAFASALVAGREYTLDVIIDGQAVSAHLTDCATRTKTSVSGVYGAGAVTARFHGRPGILHISGDIAVQWTDFAINGPRACKAVIFGDSNLEGVATGVTNPAWGYLLADTYVSARSGESSKDMVKRLPELAALRPKMAICAHGTNDTLIASWRHNVGSFVDTARAINAEPILVRPPPQPAKQALMTAIDADIGSGYFGRLRSIDFLGALSNAGDRLTWDATLQTGDGLHASNAGQTAMLAQALVDIPELVLA